MLDELDAVNQGKKSETKIVLKSDLLFVHGNCVKKRDRFDLLHRRCFSKNISQVIQYASRCVFYEVREWESKEAAR